MCVFLTYISSTLLGPSPAEQKTAAQIKSCQRQGTSALSIAAAAAAAAYIDFLLSTAMSVFKLSIMIFMTLAILLYYLP